MNRPVDILPLEQCPQYAPILAHWSYGEWYLNRTIEFELVLRAYKKRASEGVMPFSYVSLVNTMPAGMVSLKENDLWSRKDLNPWLASLYVMPGFRKRGIAEMLINRVIEASRGLGLTRIFLFLGETETGKLENYYIKRGWKYYEDAVDNDGKDTKIFLYDL